MMTQRSEREYFCFFFFLPHLKRRLIEMETLVRGKLNPVACLKTLFTFSGIGRPMIKFASSRCYMGASIPIGIP